MKNKTTDYTSDKVVKKYFKRTLAAVFINYPAVLKAVGDIKGKTVLDFGCGAGCLTKELHKKGAKVFAIDNSPKWIDICRMENDHAPNLKFILSDGSNLNIFPSRKFDVAIANMVFLSVASSRKLEKMFKALSRVMKNGGIFLFSDCHPFAAVVGKTGTKVSPALRNFCYFNDGATYKATYLLCDYSSIEFSDSHWSMGFYSRLLKKNGFMIEEIIEPKPFKMDLRRRFQNYRLPEYIMFKCRKVKNISA